MDLPASVSEVVEDRRRWCVEVARWPDVDDLPEQFDAIVTDPPYNIGELYDSHHDRMTPDAYRDASRQWLEAMAYSLKPGGSLWVVINVEWSAYYRSVCEDYLELTLQNEIVWAYTFGHHQNNKFGRDHARILYYTRGKSPAYWGADDIRVPSMRQSVYGDKRAVKAGRIPSDVWACPLPGEQAPSCDCSRGDVWISHRMTTRFKRRYGGPDTPVPPNQLPEQLVERIVLASCPPGGLILDPFAGSGTVPAVAVRLGRRAVGLDVSEAYVGSARKRCVAAEAAIEGRPAG